MKDNKIQYLFILFLQSIVFTLIALGHGHEMWQSGRESVLGSETVRAHGGIWVKCDVTESGCSFLEEDDMSDNKDWIKVNCARAFLLLANILGLVEVLLCALTAAEVFEKASKIFIPHVVLMVIEELFAVLGAILATEAFGILKDRAALNAGWSLVCLWIGCFSLLPIIVIPLGNCSKGSSGHDDTVQLVVD
ncbi:uncharacterized protein LOC142340985 [Convolutriloba macropyga]|uniref:uncharacterized protein LOC142340985 n=1 Tax=Convolutriloba macropyga TaxID=536237 RepID=UPI003F52470B